MKRVEREHTVMHNRLVGFVFEVAVPAGAEFLARPAIHLLELLFCGSDLDASFDAVGSQWACAVDVPLVEDLLLDLRVASYEVVERLNIGLGAEYGEGKVMIL